MEISDIVKKQRCYFDSGATGDVETRIRMLKKLQHAIRSRETQLCKAMKADLGKSASESYMCEVGLTLSELSYQIRHLRKWARPKRRGTDLTNFHGRSFSVREPYGCVLIMSPWNYPFLLCVEPMIGAIAAGNCCILKPSAYSPATSAAIRDLMRDVFPEEYVAVVEGGRAENSALLEERFDYIFFTGGVIVGKLVMEKAAAHLTPVTLELGGKSPCIVDRTADLKLAAARIAFGKYLNCGQTCVAPDYLLIHKEVKEDFLEQFRLAVKQMYGEKPLENPNYGKIINRKHFDRLMGLMEPGESAGKGEAAAEKQEGSREVTAEKQAGNGEAATGKQAECGEAVTGKQEGNGEAAAANQAECSEVVTGKQEGKGEAAAAKRAGNGETAAGEQAGSSGTAAEKQAECGEAASRKRIWGGEADPETLRIAPAVMDFVTGEDAVMQEEIFGPILPVLTFEEIEQAFAFVREREKPLAAYLFTRDKATEKQFLEKVSFGGGCINDTIVHLATSRMGFGGVGNSGMGSYHGIRSFETFSHEKNILKKYGWIDLPLRYQPYSGQKDRLVRMFLK